MKKEVQINRKVTQEIDFYFTILNHLRNGYSLVKICKEYNISKQNLNYYIVKLKRINAIKKIGYGVWEVNLEAVKEVKKSLQKSTQVALSKELKFNDLKQVSIQRFKTLLKSKGLLNCIFCQNKIIEFHHLKEVSQGGDDSIKNLIPVCPNHHEYIHRIGYTRNMQNKLLNFHNILDSFIVNKIRGHAFQFKLELPKIKGWDNTQRCKFLSNTKIKYKYLGIGGGGQSFIYKGKKVWLTNKSLIIYDKDSYISNSSKESKNYAITNMLTIIKSLERMFKVSFQINRNYKFKVSRQHYSKMKDELARQYDKEGKKLEIYNDKGLWFLIDNSYNLNESETVHPKTSDKDMDSSIVPFFNSLQENKGFTANFVLEALSKQTTLSKNIQQNQLIFDKNMQSHIKAIQDLSKGVQELTKKVGELK